MPHGATNIAFSRARSLGRTESSPPSDMPVPCAPWPGLQASSCCSSRTTSRELTLPEDAKRTLAARAVTGGQPARSAPPSSRDHPLQAATADRHGEVCRRSPVARPVSAYERLPAAHRIRRPESPAAQGFRIRPGAPAHEGGPARNGRSRAWAVWMCERCRPDEAA